jgi:hypothetical protein
MTFTVIKDGYNGTGKTAGVDGNGRVLVSSVHKTTELQAAIDGDGYNLNTGDIALTDGTVTSSILWFKNTNTNAYVLKALAFGQNTRGGTINDGAVVTMVRNPTALSVSNAIAQSGNRNFGDASAVPATVYAGEQGATFTGGTDIAQFYMGGGNRLYAGIDFYLPQGSTMGIKYLGNNTGAVDVYSALIGYWEN